MQRDFTEKQFLDRLEKYGFGKPEFMGYVSLPEPFQNTHVSIWNAGKRRRSQLSYLLKEYDKALTKRDAL